MQPSLLITVDTELSNFPDGQGLWGRIGSQEWGLRRLIDVFDSLQIRGTFFLDVYGGNPRDVGEQQRAAELISERGHDLQLHTHPGPAFDPKRDQLRHYSLEEQEEILELGARRIEQWTGRRPVLHRAGDWAADHRSLEALRRRGFLADFSAMPWSRSCAYDAQAIRGNGWKRIDGMLCGVGTCYHDRLTGRLRRVDLGGVSFPESKEILATRVDPFFLTLHSFSLLRHDRSRSRFAPFPEYIEQLRRFCQLAREECGYRMPATLEVARELQPVEERLLPWTPFPTTGPWSSGAGLLKSLRERLRA
jgi:peptidoglycan/xylan/chitin deacetylase (PgdA/CDA1 family)